MPAKQKKAAKKKATAKKAARGPYVRGVQRRRELLEAVLRLVARKGVSAVTHRAVAAEANVSLRATTYYFATKEDMIREAFRFFTEQSLEMIDDTAGLFMKLEVVPETATDLLAEQVRRESRNPNTSWAAEFELMLAIAREPSFAPEYREFQLRIDERLQAVMEILGSADPARDARIVLAFMRGFELEQLSRPNRKARDGNFKGDLNRLINSLVAGRD